jgi:hypothetical protein
MRLRMAFVGQSTFFEACALPDGAAPGVTTRFLEHRAGGDAAALRAELDRFAPDVVVVFRPETLPAGALIGLRAAVLGFLTEPIPREEGSGAVRHEDLERRLWELEQVDPDNVDRVVTFDPHIAQTADEVLPVWRSLPLPVSDRYYAPVTPITGEPRPVFVGRSTRHRERILGPAKHHHDILHLAFGVGAAGLEEVMRDHDVAINVHNEPYPSFENRVCLHLAAGHLVLTEPLSPTHGLEPGIDYVEFHRPDQLADLLSALRRTPAMWQAVRLRGRRKAELFRASRVYPRLAHDLLEDLSAHGSPRHQT